MTAVPSNNRTRIAAMGVPRSRVSGTVNADGSVTYKPRTTTLHPSQSSGVVYKGRSPKKEPFHFNGVRVT